MNSSGKQWLLCFDFDGTFIDPENGREIHPSLKTALNLAREKGAAIVINTGRSLIDATEGIYKCGMKILPDYIIALEGKSTNPTDSNVG